MQLPYPQRNRLATYRSLAHLAPKRLEGRGVVNAENAERQWRPNFATKVRMS